MISQLGLIAGSVVVFIVIPASIGWIMEARNKRAPEKEGEPIFDDGDFELRKMPDGSVKGEWSTADVTR
jgi:hypothetical protein